MALIWNHSNPLPDSDFIVQTGISTLPKLALSIGSFFFLSFCTSDALNSPIQSLPKILKNLFHKRKEKGALSPKAENTLGMLWFLHLWMQESTHPFSEESVARVNHWLVSGTGIRRSFWHASQSTGWILCRMPAKSMIKQTSTPAAASNQRIDSIFPLPRV